MLLNAIQSTVDDDAVVVVVVTCTRALCSLDLDLVVVVVTHRKRHQTLDIYATTRHGTMIIFYFARVGREKVLTLSQVEGNCGARADDHEA